MKRKSMKRMLLVLVMLLLGVAGNAQRLSVETIYGYLKVFPEEIGNFDSEPRTIIKQINSQEMYGYNTWRIPTNEELSLLRSKGYLSSNGKYMTKESVKGMVILVTDKPASIRESVGHEFVDLGLPSGLKWATCNVGANKPEDYGRYYAWIEKETKETYTEDNCTTYGTQNAGISGNADYDVARASWGGSWRIPTKSEFLELLRYCTWTWVERSDKKCGYIVTGPNGNNVFIPAAGYRLGTSLLDENTGGYYWSASPDESTENFSSSLYINVNTHSMGYSDRSVGFTVRPVVK